MGYGSQDGYDWMMDGYGLGVNRNWWMPPPLDIDYDTNLITGDDFFGTSETISDPYYGGFTLGFDDISNAFDVLDKDIFNDFLTADDYNFLNSIGVDADGFITDSFGADALEGLLINGEDIDPTLNPSISRQDILRMTPTSQAGHERKMLAARDELAFAQQKRTQDNIRNQIDKAYGFASAGMEINPDTGQLEGVGTFYDRENASKAELENARNALDDSIQGFVDSPSYDGRFDVIDTREYFYSETTGEYDIPNSNFGKPTVSRGLIRDFQYGLSDITEQDVEDAKERIDLTFGLDAGEKATPSGYFVAIALDLLGMKGAGTAFYVTQSAYNYVINGVEAVANKLSGLNMDFPNLNIHEIAAEVLNQQFKDKNGNPILEGVADKAKILFPFHNPEATFALLQMDVSNGLGKVDASEEEGLFEGNVVDKFFNYLGDTLFEGDILSRVQDMSEEGKFEGVESNRRTGAVGFLDQAAAFIQGLGVAGQKIFGPGLSQVILDKALFDGYPVSNLFNGISYHLGPKSAQDWVRYFENKGIDPNNVQDADISFWRNALETFLGEDYNLGYGEVTPSGETPLSTLLNDASEGGITAQWLSRVNNKIEEVAGVSIDRMQPAEYIATLDKIVNDAIETNAPIAEELLNVIVRDYNEFNDEGEFITKEEYLEKLEANGYKPLSTGGSMEEDERKYIGYITGRIDLGVGADELEGFNFYIDKSYVDNAKEAFPSLSENDYEQGFLNLTSEGQQGQEFTEGVGYNITPDSVFYSSDYVDEGDYIVMRDVPVIASSFEYRTNEAGDQFVYDPMSGVIYEFEQARLFDEPGTRDDLYTFPSLSADDLRNSDRTLNKEILKELALTGKLEYKELKDLVTLNPEFFGEGSSQGAYDAIDLELGDFFLKKYAGLTDEQLNDFNLDDFVLPGKDLFSGFSVGSRTDILQLAKSWNEGNFGGGWKMPSLEFILMFNGYTDQDFDVLPTNEAYNEDYTEESIFELRPFEVTAYENGVPLIVKDTIYGFTEDYDPNRFNENTGEYLFREYSFDELKHKPTTSEYVGGGMYKSVPGQSRSPLYTTPEARARVLKSLLEQGKITEQEAEDLDWSYFLAMNPPTPPAGYDPFTGQPYGNYTTVDDARAEWKNESIFSNRNTSLEDGQNWRDSDRYLAIEEIDLDTPFDYEPPVASFYDLPDFVVTGYNNLDDLLGAYQDRLDYIDSTNFDYSTKEFLRDTALSLYNSRKAFIELDEESKQLILDAQEEATSDFIDLGIFTVTADNINDLDNELQNRLNLITASNLSDSQEQYEIDLANAIYDSKKGELDLVASKNLALSTAKTQLDTALKDYGEASAEATALQDRINKIESYTLPDFDVIAYLNADDPTAYMTNFVNEVSKGATEEYGYFLSHENLNFILNNVSALAQSNEDFAIAQKAADDNLAKYEAEVIKYNNAIGQINDANEEIRLNKLEIERLEGEKYIELDNFVVTATDIDGAQGQLNDFNAEIDRMVRDGEITSEQGELEKSLATNTFDVYKVTQDIASAQSRIGELETYTLPDFTVEGVAAEDLDGTLSAYAQALTEDKDAGLINQDQYDALYNSASELVLGQKALNDAEADYADKEKKLNDKYNALQAQYDTYELPDMRVTGDDFAAQVQSEEIGYYVENIAGTDVLRMPDVPVTWEGTDYEYRKSLREQLVSLKREEFYDEETGNSVLTEAQIDDLMDDYRYAVEYWQSRQAWLYNSKTKTEQYNTLKSDTDTTIAGLRQDVTDLQTFSLPEFNVTATTLDGLNDYLDEYLTYVNNAEKNENISAEQAINFRNIISSLRRNGADIFTLEAANKDKDDEITGLKNDNDDLTETIRLNDITVTGLQGQISTLGAGFDVSLYENIEDLDAGLDAYIQSINDSDLSQEMKDSQIAFAQSMADMRKENLFVPTYEAPDFTVIAEGDLTGLNQSYAQAMFTLDSFKDNEYITQEEYDAFEAELNIAYNTRKDEIIPAYTLPEFTVSGLDAEGGFTNLDAEKEGFLNELQSFLDNDYITREEHDAFEQQIESAYDDKKRDITPVYEAPDFTVYGQLEPGETFEDIDTAYNTAYDELTLNAQLGYISASDYITQLNDLETSYKDARKSIAPAYELPDFSVYGQIAEGDDTTEIDTAYQNELTRLEEYKDSGYISLSEYYDFLGQLETEYTSRRQGILPTYTLPDFSVTPASSLAELEEMEQAALDRFTMFSESEYFPEDFDILAERKNLEDLIDAERDRIRGTYTLPDFVVEDTKGLLTQKDIEDLFGEYEAGLQEDVMSQMLGLGDFFSAMEDAQSIFDIEFAKRKPIQPREGDYALIPDPPNDDDGNQASHGDFLTDYEYPSEIIGGGGIDTSGILTGNYMAKLDPAYQLAEILLGQDRAKQMYPTGKSKGLADEEFQEIVNQFMLGQAEDAFELQSGLSGKMQDLATEQRRLQRQADLDLMAEFGDPYRKQLEELYPEQAAALRQQREIADISAERAKGDLSPREQAQVEQQAYLFGAGRGREFDPMTLYKQLGEETGIREQRETQATNQLTALMNMERGMYGDLPSVIGAQSPFIEGVGDIQTPFNIGGIMDLGSVDYANQQKLNEVNMAIAQLDRDYQTAVALQQPSKAQETLVKLNEYKAMADALSAGISAGAQAFGTLKDIGSGVLNFFGMGGDPYASDRAAFNKYYGAGGKGSNNDVLDFIMSL